MKQELFEKAVLIQRELEKELKQELVKSWKLTEEDTLTILSMYCNSPREELEEDGDDSITLSLLLILSSKSGIEIFNKYKENKYNDIYNLKTTDISGYNIRYEFDLEYYIYSNFNNFDKL